MYNTVFDDVIFEQLVRDCTPQETAMALHERDITHVYVSWEEINRYRKPGSYGFSEFVSPAVFRGLVTAGVLRPPTPLGLAISLLGQEGKEEVPAQELYQVNPVAPR
ncbi:MAG: hypothetical protein HY000_00160 [Planctomycetes bacterium]|nr:hypothetical protein [Planctomycetota bacterium]